VWLLAAGVSGLSLPVVLGLVFSHVNEVAPANLVTEANAWVVTAFTFGAATASLLAGVVTDHLGRGTAVPVIVLASAAVTAVAATATGRGQREAAA
jgi:sugar phosphate permease